MTAVPVPPRPSFLLAIILLLSIFYVDMKFFIPVTAFVAGRGSKDHRLNQNLRSTSKRFIHFDDLESFTCVENLIGGLEHLIGSDIPEATTSTTAYKNYANVEIESEVLQDVSHLFLDFSVFFTESKNILNLAQIVGRLLVLAQNLLPEKHIAPEELCIQVFMLAVCVSKQAESVTSENVSFSSSMNSTVSTTGHRSSCTTNNATATVAKRSEDL